MAGSRGLDGNVAAESCSALAQPLAAGTLPKTASTGRVLCLLPLNVVADTAFARRSTGACLRQFQHFCHALAAGKRRGLAACHVSCIHLICRKCLHGS